MKRIVVIILFLLISVWGAGQNPFFRQFYFNPSYFNPAYTGIDGYTDFYMATRRQWINFKDAPTVSEFSLQYPTRGRTSLGFFVSNQQAVALQNTYVGMTFAYRVPIASNKSLIFALSGGVGSGNLNLDGYDYSNDPTILYAAGSSFYGNGSFGMVYEWNRLRLGFAFPQLFGQLYLSPQQLGNMGFSQLLKQNYSASYKFFTGSLTIEPWLLFRLNNDNQNTWDVGTTVSFKEIVWLGSSFSPQQGTAFFLGMDIKGRVKVGYSYELPPASPDIISAKSGELQVRLRIGKKRNYRWAEKFEKPETVIMQSDSVNHYKLITGAKKGEIRAIRSNNFTNSEKGKEKVKVEIKDENQDPKITSDTSQHVKPGYYIITGSFWNPDYAIYFQKGLVKKGFSQSEVLFKEDLGLYLVYIYYSNSREEAEETLMGLEKAGLKSSYILPIQ